MTGVRYVSTRGLIDPVSAPEAILSGIARGGGLYVPEPLPEKQIDPVQLIQTDYQETALITMSHYMSGYPKAELKASLDRAYTGSFSTPLIAPLVKKGEVYYLELFHGPTLAFKDMALTVLPHLLTSALRLTGTSREIVILTATSGDTGKAALESFAGVPGTRIIVFFPEHGVSQIQKRQMVTQEGDNTLVVGIEGNFDDAQAGVKSLFADRDLAEKMLEKNLMFSSANSINPGRLIPQIGYPFFAYAELLRSGEIKQGELVNFVVPTGNFGNILACYYARKLGLPVHRLICASNINRVLYDFLTRGEYDINRDFFMTMSPSMDILVSSNLERLIYHAAGNDPESLRGFMDQLKKRGCFRVSNGVRENLADFYAGYASEEETAASIQSVYEKTGYLIDPHTAVGQAVYEQYRRNTRDTTKTVLMSTASPYKFTASVMKALGRYREVDDFQLISDLNRETGLPIPEAILRLSDQPVRHRMVCRKEEMRQRVMTFLGID